LLIAGTTGCAHYIGTTAGSFLKHAETDSDPNIRHLAYAKLADPYCYTSEDQKARAVAVLAQRLAEGREPVASRAQICRTLGVLGRDDARPALLRAVKDENALIRVEACRALGQVANPEDAGALSRVMTADMEIDCRLAAVEAIGRLKAGDPRIEEQLVLGMEHDDPAIRLASYRALRSRTGKDLGTEAAVWREQVVAKTGPSAGDPNVQAASAAAPAPE
jgi:HEAT repeat protein